MLKKITQLTSSVVALGALGALAMASSALAGGVTWNHSSAVGNYHVNSTTKEEFWSSGKATELDIVTSPGVPATVTGTFDRHNFQGNFTAGSPVIDPTISVTYNTFEYGTSGSTQTTQEGTLSVFDFSSGFQINPLGY